MKEEMAEGNSWEVEEVGKWVRGLRPKRRQLPPLHLGPFLPNRPCCPGLLSEVWSRQLVRDLWEGLQIGSGFSVPAM